MSILINGMKTPPVGHVLMVFPSGRVLEVSSDKIQDVYGETEAVELPPHGRLIDADVLTERLVQGLNNSIGQAHAYYRFAMAWLNESQPVIEAEGVSE